MNKHPNIRTITAIEKMMEEMQYLVDHPRMQQRNWVARGKEWLPVLQHAKEDLQREVGQQDYIVEAYFHLFSSLEHIGLKVEKRDESSWSYSWFGNPFKGNYPTRAEALVAAINERIK